MWSVMLVVGARPNFMKVAPLYEAFVKDGRFRVVLVHTGQHYDFRMSQVFFQQLGLPDPDHHLGIGSDRPARQTARIMLAFAEVVWRCRPDLVVVVGDVNSTLACSLVASREGIPLAHVEAGLRSRDRSMPEEINRVLTDRLADFLFVTEQSGVDNLRAEGVEPERIHFVGNVMIDALERFRAHAERSSIVRDLGLEGVRYGLMTVHRPGNVDRREALFEVVRIAEAVARELDLVLPLHPRTRRRLEEFGLAERLRAVEGLRLLDPLGYVDCLRLLLSASVVLTDSGGLQEESTYLRIPCLTLRDTTERPVTVTLGTNRLVPLQAEKVADGVRDILRGKGASGRIPAYWDGRASERIVAVLRAALERNSRRPPCAAMQSSASLR